MITIKFLGGAKKSFATEKFEITDSEIPLNQLIEKILKFKPENSPEIDFSNVLIAINGVDSSALEGKSTVVKNNDIVSIIPVIHGGITKKISYKIGKNNILIFEMKGSKNLDDSFLNELRKKFSKVRFQAVSSKFILNKNHLQKILFLSLNSEKNNVMLSNKVEIDLLMRFALTTQISDAINLAGIKQKMNFFLICIGPKNPLDVIFDEFETNSIKLFSKNHEHFLQRQFNISKKQLNSVYSKEPLVDLLVEKASILF